MANECKKLGFNKDIRIPETAIVNGLGILLNGFSVLCIAQILYHKSETNARGGNMFLYFMVKSICDLLYMIGDMFFIRWMIDNLWLDESIVGIVW